MNKSIKRASKFMSLVLRHNPALINAQLNENGWLNVVELREGMRRKGFEITEEELEMIVRDNDKQRFSFNEDQTLIRANQGHSVKVDVELEQAIPPDVLYHGTVEKFMDPILHEGLKPMSRQHVHLSCDVATAVNVGKRRGKPVILEVNSSEMVQDGIVFYLAKNGVWLTDVVAPSYLKKITDGKT